MPPDASYNLNGGFKPTTKRSADLDGSGAGGYAGGSSASGML